MTRIAHDARIALRGFRKTPTFTATAVLILALSIGMTVAMVTVFDAVLFRKLPVQDQDRVVVLWTYRDPTVELSIGSDNLPQLRQQSRTMRDIAGVAHWGAVASPILSDDRTMVLQRAVVTGNFFDVLGVRPALGRLLTREDGLPGAAPVFVLSHAAWQRHFGGDPGVIGRQLSEPYGQTNHTIVGIAPPGLDYPTGVEFWMPLWPGNASITVVGRLAPNVTPDVARAEFFSLVGELVTHIEYAGAHVVTLTEAVLGDVRPVLVLLTAAVVLLLLIACVNVGNLLLLRAATREREFAVRRALGASYGDIARQLIVESTLLAGAGGALGLLCAGAFLRALIAFAPAQLPRLDVIQLSGAPATVALAVTIIAVLLFGIVPALSAAHGNVASTLRFDVRSGTETRHRRRVRQALVASQVALALVLLSGAGLLVRSLERLSYQELGYTSAHVAVVQIAFPGLKYDSLPKLVAMGDQLEPRLRAIPGISAVTPILIPPFLGPNVFQGKLDIEGQSQEETDANPFVPAEVGGVDYFRTMGISLKRGRGFLETDRETAPPIAVVSEAVARRLWPNEDPIGKRIRYWNADSTTWRTVVGVAGDIRYRSLREATPTVYLPYRQAFWQGMYAIRTTGPLETVIPAMRREAKTVDPQLVLWQAQTLDDFIAVPLAQPRMSAVLMSAFGLVALLLAAIGLYGVMASVVRAQTRELGIRMALGATQARVRRDVLAQAMAVSGIGAIVGVAAALAASRLLSSQLFEVSPTDPVALGGACVVLLAVVLVAAYLPARRATQIDPSQALRAD